MSIKEKIFKSMRILSILSGMIFITSSCQQYNKIAVSDLSVDSFEFQKTTSANIEVSAQVDNPTKATLMLVEGNALLKKEGRDFIILSIPDDYSVSPQTKTKISVNVKADVLNPIEIIASGLNFASWDLSRFTVCGKLVVKSDKGFKKVIRLRDEPLENVLEVISQIF